MAREVVSDQISKTKTLLKIHVLVVDDDSTSLSIVSAMLRSCAVKRVGMNIKLVVFSMTSPIEALATLRLRKDNFDLVVSDLHMPEMNGMKLQKRVQEEFKLPVIIMSSDDKESVILKTLEKGAAFYLVKPISMNDLKNIWQYAIAAKKRKSVALDEINKSTLETSLSSPNVSYEKDEDLDSASSANEGRCRKRKKAKKRPKEDLDDDDEDSFVAHKKAKVVWTNALHNRFLEAISYLGPDKAVPKRILDFMSVAGLKRENVASHLQKYRMFLKKVAERGGNQTRIFEGPRRSNFASSLTSINIQAHQTPLSLKKLNALTTFHPGFGWNNPNPGATPSPTASTLGRPCRVSQNVDSSRGNLLSHPSNGQSRLPGGSSSSLNNPLSGSLNPSYQANRSRFGVDTNSARSTNQCSNNGAATGRNSLAMSSSTDGMFNNNNSFQRVRQETHDRLTPVSIGEFTPSNFRLGSDEIRRVNPLSAIRNIGTPNVLDTSFYLSPSTNDNYIGFQGANDGVFFVSEEQAQFNRGSEMSRGISNNGHSLSDWPRNDSLINASPIRNGTYGSSNNYSAQDDSFRGFSSRALQPQRLASNQGYTYTPLLPPSLPANLEMKNNCTILNSMSDQQQLGGVLNIGKVDSNSISNNINHYNSYINPNQPQDGKGVENANMPNNLFLSVPDTPMTQLLNSISFNFEHNPPWTHKQTNTAQLQGQEVVNTNAYGNANDNIHMENLNPTLNQIQGSAEFMDLELSDLLSAGNNAMAGSLQDWDNEFMDSSMGDDPFLKK